MNSHQIKVSSLRLAARTSFVTFVVAFLVFSQFACRQVNTEDKITYAMPITLAAMPAYVALDKGFWKDEGLDVNAKMFSSGRLALDALLAKQAEVMSVSETPLVHAILKGNSIFIVATVTEHQEVKLIGRRDHGITKAEDIKGKRIATLPGTNSDYFMYEFLKKYNIGQNEVKVTNLNPPDMITALVNGDIDAYFAWEPDIYYAQHKLGQKAIVFKPGDLYTGRHCVAMNQEYVRKHPAVVEKLLRGFIRAQNFIQSNPDEAIAITSKITQIPENDLKVLLKEYKTKIELDSNLIAILDNEGRWAMKADSIHLGFPNFKQYLYHTAIDNTISVEAQSNKQ